MNAQRDKFPIINNLIQRAKLIFTSKIIFVEKNQTNISFRDHRPDITGW